MTKEQVYDAEINPLMAQIIEICKRDGIAMLASFDLGVSATSENDDDHLLCTTALLRPDSAQGLHEAVNRIYHPQQRPLTMINVVDGEGQLVASEAII